MFRLLLALILAGGCASLAWGQESPSAEAPPGAEVDRAVRATIASYVDAFNQQDAPALARHFSERGELQTLDGQSLQGRAAIEKHFSTAFKTDKSTRLELFDTELEILAPSVVIETGMARILVAEAEPIESGYRAVHVQTAEGWKLDRVREDEPPQAPSHVKHLQPLEWMVGRWVDTREDVEVEVSCRWATNQNFLVQSFKALDGQRVDFEGTQIIGWDPSIKTIRSWTFDSDGGFAVGRWSLNGQQWTVQSLSVLPDGRRGSATNIYAMKDDGSLEFQSVGRQVEHELLPSVGPLTLVRVTE